MRVITSTSAAARLGAAREFLGGRAPATELIIVGASRGAADDLARAIAQQAGSTFGITRFSLTELAARAAAAHSAAGRRVAGSQAGAEAVAAHAVFDALGADELAYFAPVARMPGFPKALARTLHELRLAGVASGRLTAGPGEGVADLGVLLSRVEAELARAGVDDRAALFRLAAAACRAGLVRWARLPMLLLDVPLDSRAEQEFAAALVAGSPDALATVPDGDRFTLDALTALGGTVEHLEGAECSVQSAGPPVTISDLDCLRRYVFQTERPARTRARRRRASCSRRRAKGARRVEIVRRVLDEAGRGVPFDEMAVFLRTPQQYLGLLEHACARGGRAGVLRSRHAASRSGGTRVHRAAVVRRRRAVGQALRRIPVARPGAALHRRARGSRGAGRAARRRVFRSRRSGSRHGSGRFRRRHAEAAISSSTPTMRRSSPARCDRRGNGKS